MQKKTNFITSLSVLALPTIVGVIGSRLSSMGSGQVTPYLNKPPLVPPAQVFPIVWTILYVLMGIAFYLVVNADFDKLNKRIAIRLFLAQLFLNFIWPIVFFRFQALWLAFIIIALLVVLVFLNVIVFWRIKLAAGYLLIPYLLWVSFALYLNLGFCILN